jgi:lipid A 3-O-deacylase
MHLQAKTKVTNWICQLVISLCLCSSQAAEIFWGAASQSFGIIPVTPLGESGPDNSGFSQGGSLSYTVQMVQSAIQLEIQQTIYTPKDALKNTPTAQKGNPPFAGWTSASIGYYQNTKPAQLFHLKNLTMAHLIHPSVEAGLTGPDSKAQSTQKFINGLLGNDDDLGWKDQTTNKRGMIIRYDHTLKMHYRFNELLGIELAPHVTGAIGNILQYAAIGGHVRLGSSLTDSLGPPRFTLTANSHTPDKRSLTDSYWNVFAGWEKRWMHTNAFLTSNTIVSNQSLVKLTDHVNAIHVGSEFSLFNLKATITFERQTPDFQTKKSPSYLTRLGISYQT